jgi:hypothetical protein
VTALVTEALEARLERLLPGAKVVKNTGGAPEKAWAVSGTRPEVDPRTGVSMLRFVLYGTGATAREAVEKAVTLWGAPR